MQIAETSVSLEEYEVVRDAVDNAGGAGRAAQKLRVCIAAVTRLPCPALPFPHVSGAVPAFAPASPALPPPHPPARLPVAARSILPADGDEPGHHAC